MRPRDREDAASGPRRHVWMPGVTAKGGIQTYSTFFLRSLFSLEPGGRHEVFLKNDLAAPGWASEAADRVRSFGRLPAGRVRSAAFALDVSFRAAVARPALSIVGHLNFGAICEPLGRVLGLRYWILTYGVEAWSVERPVLRRALRDASRILAISRYSRDRLAREQGLDADRIDLLPCTFDPDAFRPAPKDPRWMERYGLRAEDPVVLTVARLAGPDRSKGYDVVLDALPTVRRDVPRVRYLVVGDGPDRERVERRVRETGLDGTVVLAGRVADEDLPAHYNLCDAFVMPSKKEGFGIVYLEAMGCGKPAIGGHRDGARDALLDGELGVLVDPDDPRAVADAIVDVVSGRHPDPVLNRPEEIRRRVVDAFGPARFQRRLGELLEAG